MVNREKRQMAGQLIERFVSCEVTSDEFCDAFRVDKSDPALEAIYWNVWFFYSDTHRHKLERQALSEAGGA